MNTFLLKEFLMLLDIECSENKYGDNLHHILNLLLLSLPHLLLNSIDNSITNECCTKLSS